MNKYQLIGEITALASIINEKSKHDIFVEFSGHVKSIVIRIFINGWKENLDPDINEELYTNREYSIERLEKIKQRLLKIALSSKIDLTELPYETVEIKRYKLA